MNNITLHAFCVFSYKDYQKELNELYNEIEKYKFCDSDKLGCCLSRINEAEGTK